MILPIAMVPRFSQAALFWILSLSSVQSTTTTTTSFLEWRWESFGRSNTICQRLLHASKITKKKVILLYTGILGMTFQDRVRLAFTYYFSVNFSTRYVPMLILNITFKNYLKCLFCLYLDSFLPTNLGM